MVWAMLATLITNYMKTQGITLRAMAKKMKCDHTTLFRYLKGKPVEASQLNKVLAWVLFGS